MNSTAYRPAGDSPRGGRRPRHGLAWSIYVSGVVHSAAFHTLLLLLLSAIVARDEPDGPVAIEMTFDHSAAELPSAESVPSIAVIAAATADGQSSPSSAAPVLAPLPLPPESPPPPLALEDFAAAENEVRPEDLSPATLDRVIVSEPSLVERDRGRSARVAAAVALVRAGSGTFGRSSALPAMAAGQDRGERDAGVGIGGDIGRRLRTAGAKSGALQVSIAWNTTDDIDLHVQVEAADGRWSDISWMNRCSADGGVLDVDMNAGPPRLTAGPVENVFWPFGRPPIGRITVGVHHFHSWSGQRRVPVTVVVKLADEPPREFHVVAVSGVGPQRVTTFTVNE